MHKFFVKNNQIENNKITITGEDVNHIKNVLRLEKNEKILVCDVDTEHSYITNIIKISKDNVIVEILEEYTKKTETSIFVHIFQGLPKQEKMEQIIQKATEIGVTDITPVNMERCVVKFDEKTKEKKIERWQKIAEVAAKQSKRDKIPNIHMCIDFKNIYEKIENYDIVLVAYEEESNLNIKQALSNLDKQNIKKIAVLIGPEGRNFK